MTPLHQAALHSKTPNVVAALLDAGANPKAMSEDDYTPWDTLQYNSALKETEVYWRINEANLE